jgi:hypothetical protein
LVKCYALLPEHSKQLEKALGELQQGDKTGEVLNAVAPWLTIYYLSQNNLDKAKKYAAESTDTGFAAKAFYAFCVHSGNIEAGQRVAESFQKESGEPLPEQWASLHFEQEEAKRNIVKCVV